MSTKRKKLSIISQVILTISKGYLDSEVKLDVKAIGRISVYENTQNTQTYCRKSDQDEDEIISGKTFQEKRQPCHGNTLLLVVVI
ncbi:MAG: hypothetical protein JRF64_09540 [Deltaproteobacteria bacterium]|nr:hypothetical protein [Deltaproteobacteria bacterium]